MSIRIVPDVNYLANWWWWGFSSASFAGLTPTFKIAKAAYYQALDADYRYACYSTAMDSDTWVEFGTPTIGATDIEIAPASALPSGTLFFCHMPAYPFSRTTRKMVEWLAHDYVSDTTSSTNGVIGTSTERANVIDTRTNPALPFYGFKISKPSENTKNKAILTGGNHPGESIARFVLEASIDWLLGGSAEAESLLDWFDFYVYPCVNPQGVWGGFYRSCPESYTIDHNRQWHTTGTLEDVDAFKTAMAADTGADIAVGMDYHCSNTTGIKADYQIVRSDGDAVHQAFQTAMRTMSEESDFEMHQSELLGMLPYLWNEDYNTGTNLKISISAEVTNKIATGVSHFTVYGQGLMKALLVLLLDDVFTNHPA